jgi:hypothetical protein
MDVHTLFFGTILTVLPLVAAGLLTAMVLLERRAELTPAPAHAGRAQAGKRARQARRRRARIGADA